MISLYPYEENSKTISQTMTRPTTIPVLNLRKKLAAVKKRRAESEQKRDELVVLSRNYQEQLSIKKDEVRMHAHCLVEFVMFGAEFSDEMLYRLKYFTGNKVAGKLLGYT